MPVYNYRCNECREETERFLKLENYDMVQYCYTCSTKMDKVIKPTMIGKDYEGYSCPRTGEWIEGRKQHEENLKKHGARLLEPGEREEYVRSKQQEEAKFEKEVDSTVEKIIESYSSDKLAKLANEVASGADVSINRSVI